MPRGISLAVSEVLAVPIHRKICPLSNARLLLLVQPLVCHMGQPKSLTIFITIFIRYLLFIIIFIYYSYGIWKELKFFPRIRKCNWICFLQVTWIYCIAFFKLLVLCHKLSSSLVCYSRLQCSLANYNWGAKTASRKHLEATRIL